MLFGNCLEGGALRCLSGWTLASGQLVDTCRTASEYLSRYLAGT